MLYDPKWEKPEVVSKPTEPSFSDFVEWLATKEPSDGYDFISCRECAVGRYLIERFDAKNPSSMIFYDQMFPRNSYAQICAEGPWTFGAALKRARDVMAAA